MGSSILRVGRAALSLLPIQVRVAKLVADELDDTEFALAGGAALIAAGVVDRMTQDLDFFGTPKDSLSSCATRVLRRLNAEGFEVLPIVEHDRFVRLEVSDDRERTEVDFGIDARLYHCEEGELGPALSLHEIAVDKILAVFGRTEPRDLSDLAALLDRFALSQLLEAAAEKDPGFDHDVFVEMVGRFRKVDPDDIALTRSSTIELLDRLSSLGRNGHDVAEREAEGPDLGL